MSEYRDYTDEDFDAVVTEAVEVIDGWYTDTTTDWEDVFDRVEATLGIEFPDTWDDPLFDRIKRRVRREMREE